MMKKSAALTILSLILTPLLGAQQPSKSNRWDAWQFLMGDWTGEGTGAPGEGSGGFSFALDLQGKILVRRNYAEYPAAKDRPAFSHQDLMVVYAESGEEPNQAIYFDNEGHVIHYTAQFSDGGKTLTFLSDSAPASPRFRLTYTKVDNNVVSIKFEIAPPGKPDAFASYIQARAHRKGAH